MYNSKLMARDSTIDPTMVILIIVIIAAIAAIALIIYLISQRKKETQEYIPQPVDPGWEKMTGAAETTKNTGLRFEASKQESSEQKVVFEKEATKSDEIAELIQEEEAAKSDEITELIQEEEKTEAIMTENNQLNFKEEEEMSKNFWDDEFAICKLRNGSNVEFIKLLPSTVIIRREDGKVDELPTSEVAQFIGDNNKCSMSRIKGTTEMWLFESAEEFLLSDTGEIICRAKKNKTSEGYRMMSSITKGDKFFTKDGTEVATFMCHDEGELLVRMSSSGKYMPLEIEVPLQINDIFIMSANYSTTIVVDNKKEKMEVYSGALCIAAS